MNDPLETVIPTPALTGRDALGRILGGRKLRRRTWDPGEYIRCANNETGTLVDETDRPVPAGAWLLDAILNDDWEEFTP